MENHIFTENDNRKNRISILAKSEHRACKVVKIKYPKINYCYNGVDTSNNKYKYILSITNKGR